MFSLLFPITCVFFCGAAGPETVMEVYAEAPIEYTAAEVTIRGTLQLNDNDINRLIYALIDAEEVNP